MSKKQVGSSSTKEILTPEEIQALINAESSGVLGARNKAMFMLMWKTALRRSEVVDLYPADLNWRENKVRVRNGKGQKDDFSVLPNSVKPFIEAWMLHREKLGIKKTAPLFCAISKAPGKKIFPQYIFNRLQVLAQKAGITKKVFPHIFRRSAATQLLGKGYNLTEVQAQLRHKSTLATHAYLVIANKEELAKKMADDF